MKHGDGKANYKRRNKTKINDLIYYLGEDWIDYGILGNDINIKKWQNDAKSNYQPKKCNVCKRYWHLLVRENKRNDREYLKTSIFGSTPAIKEKCWNC
tara:strand:- start:1421 stop:1714 length:294 start_codon:yes stop_codon:yes gene_type:complete